MSEHDKNCEQEARQVLKNKNMVDRILLSERMPLNPSRKKLLGYEEDDVIVFYSKKSLGNRETFKEVEAILKESNKLRVVINANNSSQRNLKYMQIANKLGHSFKVVADEEFVGDTGMVILK